MRFRDVVREVHSVIGRESLPDTFKGKSSIVKFFRTTGLSYLSCDEEILAAWERQHEEAENLIKNRMPLILKYLKLGDLNNLSSVSKHFSICDFLLYHYAWSCHHIGIFQCGKLDIEVTREDIDDLLEFFQGIHDRLTYIYYLRCFYRKGYGLEEIVSRMADLGWCGGKKPAIRGEVKRRLKTHESYMHNTSLRPYSFTRPELQFTRKTILTQLYGSGFDNGKLRRTLGFMNRNYYKSYFHTQLGLTMSDFKEMKAKGMTLSDFLSIIKEKLWARSFGENEEIYRSLYKNNFKPKKTADKLDIEYKVADARNRHILYFNKWGVDRASINEFKLRGAGEYKFIEYLKEKHFEWWLLH